MSERASLCVRAQPRCVSALAHQMPPSSNTACLRCLANCPMCLSALPVCVRAQPRYFLFIHCIDSHPVMSPPDGDGTELGAGDGPNASICISTPTQGGSTVPGPSFFEFEKPLRNSVVQMGGKLYYKVLQLTTGVSFYPINSAANNIYTLGCLPKSVATG